MNCKSKRQQSHSVTAYSGIAVFLCWGLILISPVSQGKSERPDRHVMYGFEVPYPKKLSNDLPEGRLPFMIHERLVTVTAEINSKGRVSEIRADEPQDSLFVDYYRDKLMEIRFEPGRVAGKKSSMLMPLKLRFQPNRKLPDLYLPVDSNRAVSDRDLYMRTLAANGVTFPLLETFPPYFCDLEWSDSLTTLPYVLLAIELDAGGKLIGDEVESTNYEAFALQLKSAALSAEFKPLLVNGEARASSCFLLVSFFPQLGYPTEVWKSSEYADYSFLQRSQIRLIPDTVGLLTKPFPRFFPPQLVTVAGSHRGLSDSVTASVMVSVEGELKILSYGKVSPPIRQGIQKLVKAIKFFPAMDYAGQPRDFYGMVRLIFSSSAKIRIEYLW